MLSAQFNFIFNKILGKRKKKKQSARHKYIKKDSENLCFYCFKISESDICNQCLKIIKKKNRLIENKINYLLKTRQL